MYCLNKIVGWVSSPLGAFFLAFALSLVLRRLAGARAWCRRLAAAVAAAALVCLWLASCGFMTRFIGVPLEREWSRDGVMHGSVEGLPSADAIVVLGGGVGLHHECNAPEIFGSADRVFLGARLYRAGLAKRLFLTGPYVEFSTAPLMEELGVPREAVSFFPDARNTEEEAGEVRRLLIGGGSRSPKILLVTSAWHMRRARMLFRRAGFDVVAAPTDFEMTAALEKPLEAADFLPSAEALSRNSYAVKEWIGNLGYMIVGLFR